MLEFPHGFKNARPRFVALPRCLEIPASRETVRMRFRGPCETVRATSIPQGFQRGLSPGKIRQWMENRDRHDAPGKRGMERFRGSAVGRAEREPRTVRQGPRRPEGATRPERRYAGRRTLNIMRRIPVLDSPVRHDLRRRDPMPRRFSRKPETGDRAAEVARLPGTRRRLPKRLPRLRPHQVPENALVRRRYFGSAAGRSRFCRPKCKRGESGENSATLEGGFGRSAETAAHVSGGGNDE